MIFLETYSEICLEVAEAVVELLAIRVTRLVELASSVGVLTILLGNAQTGRSRARP